MNDAPHKHHKVFIALLNIAARVHTDASRSEILSDLSAISPEVFEELKMCTIVQHESVTDRLNENSDIPDNVKSSK